MCLQKITREFDKPKKKQFYKVMLRVRRPGKPNLYYFQHRRHEAPMLKGETRKASSALISSTFGGDYLSGFHSYASLSNAKRKLSGYKNKIYRYYRYWARSPREYGKNHLAYEVAVLCEGEVHTVGNEHLRGKSVRVYVSSTLKILKEVPLNSLFKEIIKP